MLFRKIVPSPKTALSPHQVLQLTNMFLENASKADDDDIALILCQHAEAALSEAKSTSKKASSSSDPDDQVVSKNIAAAFYKLGNLLENHGYRDQAQVFFNKCKKWGGHDPEIGRLLESSRPATATEASPGNPSQVSATAQYIQPKQSTIPKNIFSKNVRPSAFRFTPPELDSRLTDTLQLACCLGLLQGSHGPDDILDATTRTWLNDITNEPDEHERLKALVTDVIRAFKRDEFKDAKAVTEVVQSSIRTTSDISSKSSILGSTNPLC